MSERIFRELPPVDPELVKALERIKDETEAMTGAAFISPSQVVVDTTGLEFENLKRECPHDLLERIPGDFTNDRRCVKCHQVFPNCQSVFDDTDYSKEQYFGLSRQHLGHAIGPVHPDILKYERPK